jgi:predicted AlkP superfamily phosphohydrolase/phosphomutase
MDVEKQSGENKLVVIGWDGATWDLLSPWLAEGQLPHLAQLIENASIGTLRSTILPLSPAAWTTIVTGQNPGKHGVFDWFERKEGSYDVEYVHTGRIAAKPIWEYLNSDGKRIGVFGLPMIYPAVPVDGFMVSGMAAPSSTAKDFLFPASLSAELEEQLGPFILAEKEVYKYGREADYLRSLLDWMEYQKNVVRYLIETKPCDIYIIVFMQSDHAQHKLWRYLDPDFPNYDPDHDAQYKDALLRVYQSLDEILGELVVLLGNDTHLMLMSDHGAGPCYGVMYVNRWLHEERLLTLKKGLSSDIKSWLAQRNVMLRFYRFVSKMGFGWLANLVSKPARNKLLSTFLSFDDVDWMRTKAYSRGAFGQIYINLEGREPQGIVKPGEEYDQIVSDIMFKLSRLKHPKTGENLITDIHARAEVIEGPYLECAADILFSVQGYLYQTAVKFGVENKDILGESEYEDSGTHRPDGILVMTGPGIKPGVNIESASVADVTPTMLALAGTPVPLYLDGRILEETFTEEYKKIIKRSDDVENARSLEEVSRDLGDEERRQLEERLRNLGYLG